MLDHEGLFIVIKLNDYQKGGCLRLNQLPV